LSRRRCTRIRAGAVLQNRGAIAADDNRSDQNHVANTLSRPRAFLRVTSRSRAALRIKKVSANNDVRVGWHTRRHIDGLFRDER